MGTTWTPAAGPDPIKRNYFIPNFGKDHDIVDSAASLGIAETQLKHKMVIPKSTRAKDLGVPAVHLPPNSEKLDSDIVTTLKNEKASSEALGQTWTIEWN